MFDKLYFDGRLNFRIYFIFNACIRFSAAELSDSWRFCGFMRWSLIMCLFAPFYNIN